MNIALAFNLQRKIPQLDLATQEELEFDSPNTISKKLYFIEINTLPGINPDKGIISYMPIAARAAGLNFQDLLAEIINSAISRYR